MAWKWLLRQRMRPLALGTLLVATDLEPTDAALQSGLVLAHGSGAALHVVHVEELSHAAEEGRRPPGDAADALERALARAGVPRDAAKLHRVPGPPADGIRAIAELVKADVIILGPPRTRARPAAAPPLGGTAMAVVLGASSPCLVAARPLSVPLERVLVPVDLSDTSRGALLVGLSWASALRAGSVDAPRTTLTVLHVVDADRERAPQDSALEREVERLRRSAGDWAGVRIAAVTTRGAQGSASAIADAARELGAGLIVLGTRGLGLDAAKRLGSVTAAVIEQAPAPMLLVPPAVWRAHAAEP